MIAADIDEFITLIVACPYWRDLLRYSGGGKLDEMRRAQDALEASWLNDSDDNEAMREHLMSAIGITPPQDPVGLLFANVTTQVAFAHAQDDSVLETLFGRFTIDHNPMLKPNMD